jgi:diguanylate cyclase (GGDEF)-like protein/PAS domain S-box-containing protein
VGKRSSRIGFEPMADMPVTEERRAAHALIANGFGSAPSASTTADHTRATMARALSWMFAAGALLALVALPLSAYLSDSETIGVLIVCVLGVATAVVIRLTWRRLPPWGYHAFLALGSAMVTAGIYLSRERPGDAELFYIWVALYAAYFFTRKQAFAHIALIGALYAAVLPTTADTGSSPGLWLISLGTLVVTAILVSALKQRLDRRIEERARSERELERSLSLLRSTLESTADGILVVDEEGAIVSFNGRFQEMWRIPDEVVSSWDDDRAITFVLDQLADPEQFLAKVRELYNRPDAESRDVLQFKDGRVFERYSLPQWASDGRVLGRVWSFRDVTDRERIQSQLRHLADHDVLTGLLNRRRFEEELARQVAYQARYATGGAVLVLDLDDFKEVNDTLGHRAGDAVISSIATLLRGRLRESDVLARLGGDEFAILLPAANEQQARVTATSLLEAVREHLIVPAGQRVRVTTSIGAALLPDAVQSAEELMVRADVAMYEAKESGRDRVCFYDGRLGRRARMQASLTWSERIRQALEENRFTLYMQPILELESGEVSQYELLLRMTGDGGELVPPRGFLPSAERCGMIHEIDTWVARRAIGLLAEHRSEGRELRLEVNISGRTIGDTRFLGAVAEEIRSAAIDPADLIFEVTETAAISNMQEARDFSSALRELGCRFALDDFGAGFGSFHYLKYLPLDYLKIDGDFIADLARNPTDQAVVRAIVDLSGRLGKQTIAEFVGDEDTLELLREYRVHYAQGYHVGRPAPVAEALAPA